MASCVTDSDEKKQSVRFEEEQEDDEMAGRFTSVFDLAWNSVRKHFPNSSVDKNSKLNTASMVILPMHDVDLIIEFCFHNKPSRNSNHVTVTGKVNSENLSAIFVDELRNVIETMCFDVTDWQTLGDQVDKVVRCVEFERKEKKIKKKRCGRKKLMSEASCVKEKNEGSLSVPELYFNANAYGKQKEKTLRPNYFIAVRIHGSDILNNISNLQEYLVKQETLLTKGVIPGEALHVTLCNLGLDTADDLLCAMEVMNRLKPELEKILPQTSLRVQGVSQFYNRAIYAKVKISEELVTLRNVLRQNIQKAGLQFREDHEEFTPHVTVVKVRRPERREFGTRNIQSSLYTTYADYVFGEQAVDAISLCAMDGQKRDDGFYVTACELHFTSN